MEGGTTSPVVSGGEDGGAPGAGSYSSSTVTKSSTTTNVESGKSVSVISNREPLNSKKNHPISSGLSSCLQPENVDFTSAKEHSSPVAAEAGGKKYCGCVLGPAPSRSEVEMAMSDLQRFLHGEAKSNGHWLQPIVYPSDSRMLQSPRYGSVQNAFNMFQREPSFQNMVVNLCCDRAVWDAILSNRAVQDLQGSVAAEPKEQASSEELDIANLILKWILGFTKSKMVGMMEMIGTLMLELFLPAADKQKPTPELTDLVEPTPELTDLVEEKIRSSLLLTVVILLIVLVTRNNST